MTPQAYAEAQDSSAIDTTDTRATVIRLQQRPSHDAAAPVDGDVSLSPTARKDDLSDPALALRLIEMVEEGSSARQAAITLGLNIRSAQRLIAKVDEDVETTRSAIRRLMQAEALNRVDDWRTAADVGARKRGNHGPAKDWLLHAGVIDALDSAQPLVQVAISIGTDQRPMQITSPLTLATTTCSGEAEVD